MLQCQCWLLLVYSFIAGLVALSFLLSSGIPLADVGLSIPPTLPLRTLRLVRRLPLMPDSASRARKSLHSSARLSFDALGDSGTKSLSVGVDGVLLNGVVGILNEPVPDPCRNNPACSFCCSFHPSNAAISPNTSNFLGSLLSKARNCIKWFVTSCRSTLSSGFPRFKKRNALVR